MEILTEPIGSIPRSRELLRAIAASQAQEISLAMRKVEGTVLAARELRI
jgi:methionine synthase II (cobalamin-independent)